MKKHTSFVLLAFLLAAALSLASCGGVGQGENKPGGEGEAQEQQPQGGTRGMDQGNTPGMDEGSIDTSEMARRMVSPGGEYSDAAFVDAMVPHHEGAVEMARVALENAEHEEIRALSREIVDAQRAEIDLFGEIREELGGPTGMMEMSEEEMEGMMGNMDAGELAVQRPFDLAFIDAMVPHHESAIEMANAALEESEEPEIREIAEGIVSTQEREIEQMRRWREEWYPDEEAA